MSSGPATSRPRSRSGCGRSRCRRPPQSAPRSCAARSARSRRGSRSRAGEVEDRARERRRAAPGGSLRAAIGPARSSRPARGARPRGGRVVGAAGSREEATAASTGCKSATERLEHPPRERADPVERFRPSPRGRGPRERERAPRRGPPRTRAPARWSGRWPSAKDCHLRAARSRSRARPRLSSLVVDPGRAGSQRRSPARGRGARLGRRERARSSSRREPPGLGNLGVVAAAEAAGDDRRQGAPARGDRASVTREGFGVRPRARRALVRGRSGRGRTARARGSAPRARGEIEGRVRGRAGLDPGGPGRPRPASSPSG